VDFIGGLTELDRAAPAPRRADPAGEEATVRADAGRSPAQLVSALMQLSYEQRTAVLLRLTENLSYAEIAEWTGRKIKTVRSDVARGLQKLRTILAEDAAPGGVL
jgi:RNA polymerase sigma factor (sigma-70 family)